MAQQFIAALAASFLGWGRRSDEGQTMAEYGLLLAGIAVVVMVAVIALGGAITGVFNDVVASF